MNRLDIRRKHLRSLCLPFLDDARPGVLHEGALLATMQAFYPSLSKRELRRELDYLALRGLLAVSEEGGVWHLRITAEGVDAVEGADECSPDKSDLSRRANTEVVLHELRSIEHDCKETARRARKLRWLLGGEA